MRHLPRVRHVLSTVGDAGINNLISGRVTCNLAAADRSVNSPLESGRMESEV